MTATACLFCASLQAPVAFRYRTPPPGETQFNLRGRPYYREYRRCAGCGHYQGTHDLDLDQLYQQDYVSATYGDKLAQTYNKIMSLDPRRSDNAGRVSAVTAFAASLWPERSTDPQPSILDVGSGLCVFLARMKAAGWSCTALDPDARSAEHARETVGVETVCADFQHFDTQARYDAVSFNKVLEHVKDPIAMLKKTLKLVSADGFVYVEVPDGESAARDSQDREEFFVDHWHVFSMASLALLVQRAGFVARQIQRLREPSSKYTLRAFIVPQTGENSAAEIKEEAIIHAND